MTRYLGVWTITINGRTVSHINRRMAGLLAAGLH